MVTYSMNAHRTRYFQWRRVLPVLLLLLLPVPLLPGGRPAQAAQPPLPPDLFGLNMYITGRERSEDEARELVRLARQIGVGWTREEISWAAWGNGRRNDFYDRRLGMIADADISIIGMLLTTPERYRDPGCVAHAAATDQPAYWCAPTDPQAYADWAAKVVERYDADGIDDAPGSPRVAAWEIWNEPDQAGTWLPQADPAAYAALLRAAYDAIKAADPTALVLNGGVMTFDAIGVGGFMDRVVALAGWDSFDVLSLHPWLIDHAPDAPYLINPRERFDVTIPGRLALARNWVERNGGGKPVWITEVGWSTCGERCEPQFAKSEAQQANYMVRTFVLAAAAGVQHVSYFQLEDKFQGKQLPWSQAAILRDDLQPKPAYAALGTLVAQLQAARFSGTGRFHTPGLLAHYQFTHPNGDTVDVLWRLSDTQTVSVPLEPGRTALLIGRDGAVEMLSGGSVQINLDQQPVYLRQTRERVRFFAETGQIVQGRLLDYWEQNGAVGILGLPLSPERAAYDEQGNRYTLQWFERARLELHPQNAPPYDVLVGRLGVETLAARGVDWRTLPTVAAAPSTECRYFPETGHSLCPPFRDYWERNGGLAVFGLPISEPLPERSADDGQVYRVQYFERNRFEHHPENPPPTEVLLGRLGAELIIN